MKKLVILALFLSGCAVAEKRDYDASVATYRTCLQERGPAGCEREKALKDLDEHTFNSKLARTNPTARTYNVNVGDTK